MKRSLFVFLACVFSTLPAFAKRMLIIGDSLTEGYGVAREVAYPAILEKKIKADKKEWTVVNAGVSGSTSAGAVSRLKWQLKSKPDLLLIALGANDGLRGLAPEELEKNLTDVIELAKKENISVVLLGMKMPPNYSQDYVKKFDAVFPKVAKKEKIKLIPFFLEHVAGRTELNQPDGIHPNEKGHAIVGQDLYQDLKGIL